MRSSLQDRVAYFERNGVATIYRALPDDVHTVPAPDRAPQTQDEGAGVTSLLSLLRMSAPAPEASQETLNDQDLNATIADYYACVTPWK